MSPPARKTSAMPARAPARPKPKDRLRILLVSMEVAPFARVGGLADVAGALPKALAALGHDVRIVMPCYPVVERSGRWKLEEALSDLPVAMRRGDAPSEHCDVLVTSLGPGVPVYLVRHASYFQPAVSSASIYPQPVEAYLFFSQAVFALLNAWGEDGAVDVLHCNDWHTALVPTLLSQVYRPAGGFRRAASLYTIHNLAYQGLFGPEVLDAVGLPRSLFQPSGVEFFGRLNMMKAGLLYADRVNTVSPTYAREILTPQFGAGLEGVLLGLDRQGKLSGILNGIDVEEYNPAADPRIAQPFSAADPAGKAEDTRALRQECGLKETDAPLVGLVGRLMEQKGLDILAPVLDRLIRMGFQFVVLGQGSPPFELHFQAAAARAPQQLFMRNGFDEGLGQRIYAGCDVFLMPSRFEPCGLGQLMAQRYGTLPVVRRTGGLADTVIDEGQPGATGFVFDGTAPETLLECMKRVRSVYADRERWKGMVHEAMTADFSWTRSAQDYARLYTEALSGAGTPPPRDSTTETLRH